MPEYDHDGVDDEMRALLEQKEREVDHARTEGVFFGILSVGYVWVVFNGLWGLVEKLLREFLPPGFAVGYTIAIIGGIGGLILYRGFTGENWFNEFHPGWKGRVFGLAWFTFVSTFIILLIWVITAPPSAGPSSIDLPRPGVSNSAQKSPGGASIPRACP